MRFLIFGEEKNVQLFYKKNAILLEISFCLKLYTYFR